MPSCSKPVAGYGKYMVMKRAASQVCSDFQDRSRLSFVHLQSAQQCRTLSLAGGILDSLIEIINNVFF